MPDPIAAAARATARRMAADYGPGLSAEVEFALHTHHTGQRSNRYLDPVSVGSLIVAIATLAWTVYSDLRRKTPEPSPEAVARQVLCQLRQNSGSTQDDADRITEIVVTEITWATRDPGAGT